MHVRRVAVAAVLSLAPLGLLVPASHAAVPQCDGLDATIVGTDAGGKTFGTDGADVAVLGAGKDTFVGKGGDDVVCAGGGDDVIYPGAGNDTVFGADGNDTVIEGAGDDHLNGGNGHNTLTYDQYSPDPKFGTDPEKNLRIDARIGKATSPNGIDLFKGFEILVGSPGTDTIIGSKNKDYLYGDGGPEDTIYGFGGNDHIVSSGWSAQVYAGDGDDHVLMKQQGRALLGDGDDHLMLTWMGTRGGVYAGGNGADGVAITSGTAGFEINLNRGFLKHKPAEDVDRSTLTRFENVRGSDGPDRIVGNELPNYLAGMGGDDTILGLGGDDHLFGSDGLGGGGTDTADGGSGHDWCLHFTTVTSCAVSD